MIFDTHVHISLPSQNILHHNMNIDSYVDMLQEVGGGKAILCLNPHDEKYMCRNAFIDNKLHKSCVESYNSNIYKIRCTRCNTYHYIGEDVFRDRNVELLECANKYNLYTLAFLTGTNYNIQKQSDFYESFYPDFVGYKVHPTITMFPIDQLYLCSKKPVLVHCGVDKFSSPLQIINFAKKYKGNVIIAHWARFDKVTLKQISEMENIWIDTSPYTFLFSLFQNKPEQIFYDNEEKTIKDFFLQLMNFVGVDKILFASDSPWGNLIDEVSFINQLDLDKEDKAKILYKNAYTAFKLTNYY